jgi:LacI family transcriptional regulator
MPVVLADRSLKTIESDVDTVFVDTRRGAYAAVEYLVQRGYRRIAMVGGPDNISTANEKTIGYRQALTDHKLDLDDALAVSGDYTETGGCAAARYLLGLQHPPDAVLVANNQMSLGFFTCLRERGIRVPQEVAFVGFDDASWSSIAVPPITVVDQPTYDMGKIAAQMILDRIDDSQRPPRHEVLPTRLIIRGSC